MSDKLILTIDFGTQSVRASLFDAKGESLAQAKETYSPAYYSLKPNYAEQDPHSYYESLCKCTKRLASEHPDLFTRIAGITLTCFRDSAVMLDENNKVIRPMILWLDQRTAKCENKLPVLHRFLFRLVGKTDTIDANRKRSMANWIKENEPENWAKCKKWLPVSTYFHFLLTGQMLDSASNASGHYPINFKKGSWYKNPDKHFQGQIFGLSEDKLPKLVAPGSIIGKITEEASIETGIPAGTILYSCGSDKSCETLGLGVIDDMTAALSYGTACTVETTVKKYVESEPFLPAFPAPIKGGYYNMDVQIYRGYWMINWFLKEFAGQKIEDVMSSDFDADYLNSKLHEVPAGSNGLVLQPYWGPGLARPNAKGAVVGFSDSITQEHFYKAIIEGICYALRESLEHFEKKLKHKIPNLRISGGGSQSDEICQITADVFQKPVTRVQTFETCSLGAAIAGFMAIGEYKNVEEATKNMVRPSKTFTPNIENKETYDYLFYKVYQSIFPSLNKTYNRIKQFNRLQNK
ncbi:MAG: FGGY-family carbohydrate kinase [Bacilli bacterium]|nr:FGGY-family carbohydrate kinase [Bacilli bacterium]